VTVYFLRATTVRQNSSSFGIHQQGRPGVGGGPKKRPKNSTKASLREGPTKKDRNIAKKDRK